MEQKIVTIIGGTGFVGRYVVRQLASAGWRIRVISRNPDAALHLKTAGDVGQIVLVGGNLTDPNTLVHKLDHSYAVINLAGILSEGGRQRFSTVHAQGAEKLAKMAAAVGVQRFIHVSALGIEASATRSSYARSKLAGEKAVIGAFPGATILRPSVIFGPEDHFFNLFAWMATISPFLPAIGGGKSKFQPVYVGDVANAIEAALNRSDTLGRTYELGGPRIWTFKEILQYVIQVTGRHCRIMRVPFAAASLKATFLQLMPRPLLTRDQVKLLKFDNIVKPNALTLANLGVHPTAVEMVVPDYLALYNKKAAA